MQANFAFGEEDSEGDAALLWVWSTKENGSFAPYTQGENSLG